MASDVTCFDNIIGLTRTPCSDYTDIDSDYTTSDSGLYLDELFPLSKIESLLNCKVGENVFTFMEKAREQAIIDFRIDATAMLTQANRLKRNPFKGRIGKVKRDKTLTSLTVGDYYGIVLRCDDIVGGEIEITDISTIFDTTGTITLYIYDNLNTLHDTLTLDTTADTLDANTVSVTLPTHSEYVENLEYYFVYQLGAILPYNNEFYNTYPSAAKPNPSQSNKQFGYTDYFIVSGVRVDDLTDFSDLSVSRTNRCYGLSIGLTAKCNVDEIWCYDEMDYSGNAVDMAIAKAVRLKAVSNLVRDIALSENLNFETALDGETLGVMDERWTIEYSDMIDWIVRNIDVTKTDCFECDKGMFLGVNTIWS